MVMCPRIADLIELVRPAAGGDAADTPWESDNHDVSALGIVPHQIRGFLSRFETLVMCGPAFGKCPACSARVVAAYRQEGVDFLMRVINDPHVLEVRGDVEG
jgi:ubiquitin-like modifier-activating enzyme ATG7